MADRFTLDEESCELADVAGFRTGAAGCGLKSDGPDVGVVLSENERGTGTAVISHGVVYAPPVRVSAPRAASGHVRAIVVNSGNSNCCTGEKGLADAREMIQFAAEHLSAPQEQVILASAGEVGAPLPMDRVREGIEAACREALDQGRGDVAAAIVPAGGGARRIASCSGTIDGEPFRIAGVARGLGCDSPGAPTRLAVIVTDVAVQADCLGEVLRGVVHATFDRLDFDGRMSVGDTVALLASGAAGNDPLEDIYAAGVLSEAVEAVARRLALELAFEGEDGTRLVEIAVTGAATDADAELAAKAIAGSASVRMALHRAEPCWGLVLAAAGKLGARLSEQRSAVRMNGVAVAERGRRARSIPDDIRETLASDKVIEVELDLGLGEGASTLWTSDLSDGERGRLRSIEAERDMAMSLREQSEEKLEEVESARAAVAREAKSTRVSLEMAERKEKKLKTAASASGALEQKIKELEAEKAEALKESKRLRASLEKAEEDVKAGESARSESDELKKKVKTFESEKAAMAKTVKRLNLEVEIAERKAKKAKG